MSILDLDLNIDNYELHEVESFMRLVSPYTLNDVIENEKLIISIVSQDINCPIEKKSEFIQFMKNVKQMLVQNLKKQLERTIQNDQLLPDEEYVIEKDVGKVVNQTSVTQAGGGNSFVQNKETISFNDVIDKEKYLNPVETYPTNIARSDLNVLKRKTILQTVVLNTSFRMDYMNTSSTNFSMVLPYQFKNVMSMRLSSIQLPNVLYCFSTSKENNVLYLEETEGAKAKGKVTLPDGNYTLAEIVTTLEAEINSQLGTGGRFTVTSNQFTNQITISNTTNKFILDCGTGARSNMIVDTMGWILGFRNTLLENEKSYTAPAVYNPTASETLYFVLNDFNNSQSQNILAMFAESFIDDNILAMIPLTSESFHITFSDGSDLLQKKRTYFGPVNIQRIRVEIRDKYGEIADLQSMDFSFSLELEVGYDW